MGGCGCTGCCDWPHGRISVYAMIVSIATFLFVIAANSGCYYVQIQGFMTTRPPYGVTESSMESGIGVWSFENVTESSWVCTVYTEDMLQNAGWFDGGYISARVFASLATTFVGISMVILMLSACLEMTQTAWKGVALCLVLGSIFEWLTFTLFASSICDTFGSCKFYIGAAFAIIGALVSFVCALVVLKIPPRGPDMSEGAPAAFAPGTETVTETTMPDGTKKITKTTVNPDGSQTVEETIQQPS